MIQIRKTDTSEIDKIDSFYKKTTYKGGVKKEDTVLVATEDGKIIGVVRLCPENGYLVLRGMEILDDHQKKGTGTKMLQELNQIIGNRECYCLPYASLEKFYNTIGFQKITIEEAPPFLQKRIKEYQKVYLKPGIVMKKDKIT